MGGKFVARPLLAGQGLPIILGSLANTKNTLRVGWHITSLTWWGLAAYLAYLQFTADAVEVVFLWMVCAVFAISGVLALVYSRGAHLSWGVFLFVAALVGYRAFAG